MNNQAILIKHSVANFDTWKAAYDAHADKREGAGIVASHLNRGAEDTNEVTVFFAYNDRSKIDAFLESADLREAMTDAGVQGPPEVTFLEPVEEQVIWDRQLPAILVRHRVADFETWKAAYDGFDGFRQESGIVGHAVNRTGDDGNTVVVYHQAESLSALQQFMASPELKSTMADAGVLEAPQVDFVNGGI